MPLIKEEAALLISGTTNYVPKINGIGYVDSQIFDNGTNISIGTTSPMGKFHIQANINDITGQSGQVINNINTGTSAAVAIFFRNDDNKGFEIGTVSSTHTVYQDTYGTISGSFFVATAGGGDLIFKQRTAGKSIKFFNAGQGVISGVPLLNISDTGVGIFTNIISALFHIKGVGSGTGYVIKVDNQGDNPLFYVREDGRISVPLLQTGNVGLTSGDLYIDTAANALINGDLIVIRKS